MNGECKKTNGKIVFEAVIISHNHNDHYSGIVKILNDKTNYTVKKIYRTGIDFATRSDLKSACNSSPAVETVMTVGAKETLSINGTTINIYGPAKNFTSGKDVIKSFDVNNSSMIVTARNRTLSCLLLGDLYLKGINAAYSKYGTEIFDKSYTLCKYGHHGSRGDANLNSDGSVSDEIKNEIKFYNTHVKASWYYLTLSKEKSQDSTNEKKNFKYLINNLQGSIIYFEYISGWGYINENGKISCRVLLSGF